jgi:prepilin peptidase CpaA
MIAPAWFELALLLTAGAAALEDLASRRIPNDLLAAALGCALVMHGAGGSLPTMAGGMAAGLLLLPLYILRGMGAGDIKLLVTLGAFGGPLLAVQLVLAATLVFGVVAYVGLRLGLCIRQQTLPFAPALAAGSVFALALTPR